MVKFASKVLKWLVFFYMLLFIFIWFHIADTQILSVWQIHLGILFLCIANVILKDYFTWK